MQHPEPQQPPPALTLLTLPPEIRNTIYDHILSHDLQHFATSRRRPTFQHTCRQIRHEYESTFLASPAIHYFAYLDLPCSLFPSHDSSFPSDGAPYRLLDPARKRAVLATSHMLRPVTHSHLVPPRAEGRGDEEDREVDREIARAARRGVEERSGSLHRMGFPGVGYTAVVWRGTVSYSVFVDRRDYRATCGSGSRG